MFRRLILGATLLVLGVLGPALLWPASTNAFEGDYSMHVTLSNQPTNANLVDVKAYRDNSTVDPKSVTLQWKGSFWDTGLISVTNPDACSQGPESCTWRIEVKEKSSGNVIGAAGPTLVKGGVTGGVAKTWNITVPALGAAPTTGTLSGHASYVDYIVTPNQTKDIPSNVPITLTQTAGGSYTAETRTDPSGNYVFRNVPPGTYSLKANGGAVSGLNNIPINVVFTGIQIAAGNTTTKNIGQTAAGTDGGPGSTDGKGGDAAAAADADPCRENAKELGWLGCPIMNTISDAVTWFDDAIINLLKINADTIFNTSLPSGKAFHTAWGVFRNIAYALLVIFGLVMVISQIMGLELLDAYTIKKMLPKLILAVIFVALSWNVMHFLFDLSNEAAGAVMDLIMAPFSNVSASSVFDIGDFSLGILIAQLLGAVAVGGVIYLAALGIGGVLALVATIALFVFSAFILLSARTVVAYLLIISAPVAIICSAFEPFKKLFSLWRGLLITILLSLPAIAAIIQLSHVGAYIAFLTDNKLSLLTAFAIFIAGYALIWTVFKKLDQVVGQLGNVIGGLTGKLQKGLSDYRSNQYKNRSRLWKQGTLFQGKGAVSTAMRNIGLGIGAAQARSAASGRGGIGAFISGTTAAGQGGALADAKARVEQAGKEGSGTHGDTDFNEIAFLEGSNGKSRKEVVEALANRFVSRGRSSAQTALADAEKAMSGAEQDYHTQYGQQLILAAAVAAGADPTAFRKGNDDRWKTDEDATRDFGAGLTRLYNDGNGPLSLSGATEIMVQNKGRAHANGGFGATMGFIGGGKDTRGNVKLLMDQVVSGSNVYSMITQRWEQAQQVAEHWKGQLELLKGLSEKQEQAVPAYIDADVALTAAKRTGRGVEAAERAKEAAENALGPQASRIAQLLKDKEGKVLTREQAIMRLTTTIDAGLQIAKTAAPLNAQQLTDRITTQAVGTELADMPEFKRAGIQPTDTFAQATAKMKQQLPYMSDIAIEPYGPYSTFGGGGGTNIATLNDEQLRQRARDMHIDPGTMDREALIRTIAERERLARELMSRQQQIDPRTGQPQ